MHGFNYLKCSVTPDFLIIDHFLCRLSTSYEKLPRIIEFRYYFSCTVLAKAHLKGLI